MSQRNNFMVSVIIIDVPQPEVADRTAVAMP